MLQLLTMVGNGALAYFAENMVDAEIKKEMDANRGMIFDPVQVKQFKETAVRGVQLVCAIFAAVGVVLIGLGIAVYSAPVLCTVLGLVLYVGGWLVGVALTVAGGGEGKDIAQAMMSGIIIKVIIIIALVRAVQAAIAYQREEQELRYAADDE